MAMALNLGRSRRFAAQQNAPNQPPASPAPPIHAPPAPGAAPMNTPQTVLVAAHARLPIYEARPIVPSGRDARGPMNAHQMGQYVMPAAAPPAPAAMPPFPRRPPAPPIYPGAS